MVDHLSAGQRWPAGEADAGGDAFRLLARFARVSPAPRAVAGADDDSVEAPEARRSIDSELLPPRTVDAAPPSCVRMSIRPGRDAEVDDAALVREALAGNTRAHGAIWRRYGSLVRSKLGRSLGTQDVEDQVQEVFLRLFEYLEQLRDPNALRSFIIGITLRTAGTELRRRRCRWWLNLTATGELPEPGSVDDGETRQVVARLLEIVGQLAPQSSRVFELRYIEERELTEVAEAMSISLATAKRYLARASARVFAISEREPALAAYLHG
jgi:RNA polymerase sigma-70 factor (ECF subfamily)